MPFYNLTDFEFLREMGAWSIFALQCFSQKILMPIPQKILISKIFAMIGTRQMMSNIQLIFLFRSWGGFLILSDLQKTLVSMDSHMTYDTHISYLVFSCLSKLVQISRNKNSFDRETLEWIITSLVFSKMLYCSSVQSNTSSKNIQKLHLIMNFACKIITGARKYDHVTPLLNELNWLPVSEMFKVRDAVMIHKCVNNLAPEYF